MANAVSMTGFHVARAVEFYNKDDIYFVLAKETGWPEGVIKFPSPDDEIEGPWGYKKVDTKYLVVPDEESGSITHQGTKWRIVLPENAHAEKARWVYISTQVLYDELPFKVYHQVGIVSGLKKVAGVPEGKYNLLPNEVQDPGILEVLDNRPPVGRDADMREHLGMIMEF